MDMYCCLKMNGRFIILDFSTCILLAECFMLLAKIEATCLCPSFAIHSDFVI